MQLKAFAISSTFVAVALMVSSCTEAQSPAEPPVKWQSHLVEAQLRPNFVPAISERVYVPVYSHIYYGDTQRVVLLVGTLSIRNTDAKESMIVKSIRYYDTDGKLIQDLVNKPVAVGPLATAEVVVPRTNTAGGSGANFIIDWMSSSAVSQPIMEAVMVSTGAPTLSFTSRGEVISKSTAQPARKKAAAAE